MSIGNFEDNDQINIAGRDRGINGLTALEIDAANPVRENHFIETCYGFE
jgi:hypothetical protein